MYKFKINQIKVNSIDGIQEIAPKSEGVETLAYILPIPIVELF